jgi:glycosyltransferase involved in cell wall biosynthesis
VNKSIYFSIIIPFFNRENYLRKAIDSVLNQSLDQWELILVNDGSKDNSLEVATKYLPKINKGIILTIENSGAAVARNTALQKVSTKYVTFLDADDVLHPNMMEEFALEIEKTKADLLLCDIEIVSEDGLTTIPSKWHEVYNIIHKSTELANTFYKEGLVETIWSKVFLTSIAQKITFDKDLKLFDDRPFVLEFILMSETVRFLPKKLITNYCRKASLTRRVLSDVRVKDVHRLFEVELEVVKRNGVEDLYKNGVFKSALDYFMDTFLIQIIDKNEMVSLHEVRNLYQEFLFSFSKKLKSEGITFDTKNKLALLLLKMPNYVGWNISNFILSVAKRKRLHVIKTIKNQ